VVITTHLWCLVPSVCGHTYATNPTSALRGSVLSTIEWYQQDVGMDLLGGVCPPEWYHTSGVVSCTMWSAVTIGMSGIIH